MNHKLSYYLIFSDAVNAKEDKVLFCTRTGEAFLVNKQTTEYLLNNEFSLVPSETMELLIKAKGIVPQEDNELDIIRNENKTSISDSKQLYVVVQPSANCQLGCYYCGQSHTKDYMKKEHMLPMLERVRGKAATGEFEALSIGWFGGEPLMALQQIRELTKEFKKIAADYSLTYDAKIVTNGLSLKTKIFEELATELGMTAIEITLDGTAEFHDEHRYTKEGGKSFDLIFKNLQDIFSREDYFKLGCPISIRCNVDQKNWEGVSPLIKLLADHHLQEKLSYFYPMGVYSWAQNDAQKGSLTKEQFAEQEVDWYIEMFENGFVPNVLPRRQKQVCMAVSNSSEMYDAFGNVFNCTEVSYTDAYKDTPYVLGNVKDLTALDTAYRPLSDWNDTLSTSKFPCHTCKMLPVCGGGCPKAWYEDLRACPSFKFNIKERLALSYVISKSDIKALV